MFTFISSVHLIIFALCPIVTFDKVRRTVKFEPFIAQTTKKRQSYVFDDIPISIMSIKMMTLSTVSRQNPETQSASEAKHFLFFLRFDARLEQSDASEVFPYNLHALFFKLFKFWYVFFHNFAEFRYFIFASFMEIVSDSKKSFPIHI